jgi:hypothetical protein
MWFYNDKEIHGIEDMPEDVFGFIYETIHIPTGKKYIGKKSLMYNQKKKLTKKELAEQTGPGRKPTHKQIQVESDWKTYYGYMSLSRIVLKNVLKIYHVKYYMGLLKMCSQRMTFINMLGKFFLTHMKIYHAR